MKTFRILSRLRLVNVVSVEPSTSLSEWINGEPSATVAPARFDPDKQRRRVREIWPRVRWRVRELPNYFQLYAIAKLYFLTRTTESSDDQVISGVMARVNQLSKRVNQLAKMDVKS